MSYVYFKYPSKSSQLINFLTDEKRYNRNLNNLNIYSKLRINKFCPEKCHNHFRIFSIDFQYIKQTETFLSTVFSTFLSPIYWKPMKCKNLKGSRKRESCPEESETRGNSVYYILPYLFSIWLQELENETVFLQNCENLNLFFTYREGFHFTLSDFYYVVSSCTLLQ